MITAITWFISTKMLVMMVPWDFFAFGWCLGMCLQDMCEADVSNLFEASVEQVNLVKVVGQVKLPSKV